ncbi:MAG: hypothetical protein ACRDZZ_03430 [Ilumatobacteraceae bacterium]
MRRALRSTSPSRRRRALLPILPLLAAAALVGCGGGNGGGSEVASIDTSTDTIADDTDQADASDASDASDAGDGDIGLPSLDGDDDSDDGSDDGADDGADSEASNGRGPGVVVMQRPIGQADDPAAQDAQVEYARCMRDHGIDFPDPNPEDGATRIEIDDPDAWQEAEEECREILEEVIGTFEPPSEEDQAEMREQMLEFTRCMREHGIDMPDPQFSDDGRITVGGPGEDASEPIGPDSDEFQDAAEECGGEGGPMFHSESASEED